MTQSDCDSRDTYWAENISAPNSNWENPNLRIEARGRAKVRVLTETSLFFLSQINTFNASSSLNKNCNKFNDMRPLDQIGLNIWVWNCIKELCKESGEVLGLTSNHLKVGPPQTLRASPSWHFPKNASTFIRIDILILCPFQAKNHFFLKWSKRVQMGSKWVPNDQKHIG